jgi:hypothetical protein
MTKMPCIVEEFERYWVSLATCLASDSGFYAHEKLERSRRRLSSKPVFFSQSQRLGVNPYGEILSR